MATKQAWLDLAKSFRITSKIAEEAGGGQVRPLKDWINDYPDDAEHIRETFVTLGLSAEGAGGATERHDFATIAEMLGEVAKALAAGHKPSLKEVLALSSKYPPLRKYLEQLCHQARLNSQGTSHERNSTIPRWKFVGGGVGIVGCIIIIGLIVYPIILPDNLDGQAAARVKSIGGEVEWIEGENKKLKLIKLLDNRKVTDEDLKKFKGQSRLEILILGGTPITDKGVAHLQDLPKLSNLNLQATEITDEGLKQVAKNLPTLEYLFLADTAVTDAGLKDLGSLKKLSSLHLRNSKVTGSGLHFLDSLPSLIALRMGGPSVNVDALKAFKGLKNLHREFELLDVPMTAAVLDDLRRLPKDIGYLWISKDGLSDQQMKAFQKEFPQAHFK